MMAPTKKRRPAAGKRNPHSASPPYITLSVGARKVDSALAWLVKSATARTLADGTITHHYDGRVPGNMVDTFGKAAKVGLLRARDTGPETVLTWESDDGGRSFSLAYGNYKSTRRNVRFTANDYRAVPEYRAEAFGKACKAGLTRRQAAKGERLYYVELHSNNHEYDRRECFRSAEPVGWVLTGVPARGKLLHAVSWHLLKRGAVQKISSFI